jgi:hypothetical protein
MGGPSYVDGAKPHATNNACQRLGVVKSPSSTSPPGLSIVGGHLQDPCRWHDSYPDKVKPTNDHSQTNTGKSVWSWSKCGNSNKTSSLWLTVTVTPWKRSSMRYTVDGGPNRKKGAVEGARGQPQYYVRNVRWGHLWTQCWYPPKWSLVPGIQFSTSVSSSI